MTWRVEQAGALSILRELPGEWAQTCVTSPPSDLAVPYLLAVLDEVRRVLRLDGTLWLRLPPGADSRRLVALLREAGWLRPTAPRMLAGGHLRGRFPGELMLLTKRPAFLYCPVRALPSP